MDTNRVTLQPEILSRCRQFGADFIASCERRDYSQSLAFSSHGAEANVTLQTSATATEWAFALWISRPRSCSDTLRRALTRNDDGSASGPLARALDLLATEQQRTEQPS
jgi:hypothetical protein